MNQGNGNRTILIVEDEKTTRDAYRNYLTYLGHDVAAVATAREATRVARQNRPEVVICDWQLGHGESSMEAIREMQKYHDFRVIFLSAKPIREVKSAAGKIRAQCFLRKPVELDKLAEFVESGCS